VDHRSPLAAYLEGEGSFEPDFSEDEQKARTNYSSSPALSGTTSHSFAPCAKSIPHRLPPPPIINTPAPQSDLTRAYNAWSTAWNAQIGRADNAKFIEHFRYIIVASQLLNEYLDHGASQSVPAPCPSLDGAADDLSNPTASASLYGAAATAVAALALAYLLQWTRSRQDASLSKSRVGLALIVLLVVAFVGYQYGRRQWLQSLRRQAVGAATDLTSNWQAFELSSSSALSFIQEVELVSKGYRLSTPLPPASRLEDNGPTRRCAKLRKALHKAYSSTIPTCIDACVSLRTLIEEDDLDKYMDVYDISTQDAKEASGSESLAVLADDPESLKSLRVFSYRFGVLRRLTLCSLMALEADGGKPDIDRWRIATDVMRSLNEAVAASAERIREVLKEMEHFNLPVTPVKLNQGPAKDKMRSQVRKISALSSGIRGLQAKMQILREETNRSIEQSDDLTDLGPGLMAQYESIGADLKELMQAWETGKQSLQSNITRQERRISLASSGLRSPVSSIGGLTAVEENDGSPADALRVLTGGIGSEYAKSNRSSMTTTPSDEEMLVFEGVSAPMPRQRPRAATLTREERILKMHEERERQAALRAQRDANTSMLRELETVINLRPKRVSVAAAAAGDHHHNNGTPTPTTRVTSL